MKYLKFFFCLIPFAFAIIACSQSDDICTSGGTPRMKVRFKKAGHIDYTVDSLYVSILYGKDTLRLKTDSARVDSVMIPLKVNGDGFTDIFVKTRKKGKKSHIKMTYTETSQYVSPGCGIRKVYDNVQPTLVTPNPVINVESNATKIYDETKTVLFFDF